MFVTFTLTRYFFNFGIWKRYSNINEHKNIEIAGIICGIFLKNCKTNKISKILEYGIFNEIFQ